MNSKEQRTEDKSFKKQRKFRKAGGEGTTKSKEGRNIIRSSEDKLNVLMF